VSTVRLSVTMPPEAATRALLILGPVVELVCEACGSPLKLAPPSAEGLCFEPCPCWQDGDGRVRLRLEAIR
jgi:hypothetical protein